MEVSVPSDFGLGRLFQSIREAVVVADAGDERIVLWNREAERLLGYGADEAVGMPLELLVPERLRGAHRAGIDGFRGTGRGAIVDGGGVVEVPALRKDGAEVAIELTLTPIEDEARPGRFVMALMRDVTGRRQESIRREALLHAARRCAAQATSEQVLRALLEEAVRLIGGDDGGIARWEVRQAQLVQVDSYLPSQNQGAVLDMERSVSGRAARAHQAVIANDYPREGDPNSPAGRLGITAGVAVPLVYEGRLLGTLSVGTFDPGRRFAPDDADALELLAGIGASALIGRERAELEGALAVRNDVLAEVSHDLRTPLTAARGQVQLLQRDVRKIDGEPGEKLARGLERVDRAIGRMTQLIDLLRDVALLEAGQPLELYHRPVDLIELARAEVAEYEQLAPTHRLRLVARRKRMVGRWDAARLERVLDNLIDNAIKYSPEGGQILVSVRSERVDGADWAVLAVRDRGVGIPASGRPHVFERFYRAANVAGRIRGTGIGLAGARQIVEQHGGSIAVESREGRGSTFTVRLPLDAAHAPLLLDPGEGLGH